MVRVRLSDRVCIRVTKSAARQTPISSECGSPADLRCLSTSPRHAALRQSSLVAGA